MQAKLLSWGGEVSWQGAMPSRGEASQHGAKPSRGEASLHGAMPSRGEASLHGAMPSRGEASPHGAKQGWLAGFAWVDAKAKWCPCVRTMMRLPTHHTMHTICSKLPWVSKPPKLSQAASILTRVSRDPYDPPPPLQARAPKFVVKLFGLFGFARLYEPNLEVVISRARRVSVA